jgi:hypothetical protein
MAHEQCCAILFKMSYFVYCTVSAGLGINNHLGLGMKGDLSGFLSFTNSKSFMKPFPVFEKVDIAIERALGCFVL